MLDQITHCVCEFVCLYMTIKCWQLTYIGLNFEELNFAFFEGERWRVKFAHHKKMVHCLAGSSGMTDQSTKFISSNISKVANYENLVSRKFSTYTVVLFPVQLLPFHGHTGSGRGGLEREYWAIMYPMSSKTV